MGVAFVNSPFFRAFPVAKSHAICAIGPSHGREMDRRRLKVSACIPQPANNPSEAREWKGLQLKLVELEIERVDGNTADIRDSIEKELKLHGDPVRWAIVDTEENMLKVEGVVSMYGTED